MPISLSQTIEAQALRETEDSLRELMRVGHNIGLKKASLAMMLRTVADDLDEPPSILVPGTDSVQ